MIVLIDFSRTVINKIKDKELVAFINTDPADEPKKEQLINKHYTINFKSAFSGVTDIFKKYMYILNVCQV